MTDHPPPRPAADPPAPGQDPWADPTTPTVISPAPDRPEAPSWLTRPVPAPLAAWPAAGAEPTAPTATFGEPTILQNGADRRRRRGPVLVAVAVVVAILLGGGAIAGVRGWLGHGAQPESAVPASVPAFLRLDLAPGWGERLQVSRLLEKFPTAAGAPAVEQVEASLFAALGITGADHARHIKPWFAHRVGVGLWVHDQHPFTLIAAASRDDAAAAAGLTALRRAGRPLGFAVRDGFALITLGGMGAQPAAVAAADAAAGGSLADLPAYREAVGWLPPRQTLVGWADFARIATLLVDIADRAGDGVTGGGRAGLDQMTGMVTIGAEATNTGIELRSRFSGADTSALATGGSAALARLGEQPADSAVAAAVRLGPLPEALGEAFTPPDVEPPGLADDPEFAAVREQTRRQFAAMRAAIASLSGASVDLTATSLGAAEIGLRVSADLTSTEAAQRLQAAIAPLFGDGEVRVERRADVLELRTPGFAAGAGRLGDSALYRRTMAGMPADAAAAAYLDVQRLAAIEGGPSDELAPVKAVGFAAGTEDGAVTMLLRVVIE